MKNINNIYIVMTALLMSSLLLTCKKENDKSVAVDNEVTFAINFSNLKSASMLKGAMDYNLSDVDKIILTIQNSDGSLTKYTSSEIKIQQMNGDYYTQKIVLKTGNYKLTEFLLLNAADSTILAAPIVGSQEAQNVSSPLPVAFSVAKNITTPVNVEVLSTEKKKPEDFGLNRFPIIEVKTFGFMIGITGSESDKLLTAKLTVSNGAYSYVQNLDSITNNVVTVKDGLSNYTLTVEKSGYNSFTHTYPIDSLKMYKDTVGNVPLIIELEAAAIIGQSYGGGIIFYIDGTGQHGLIAANNDQSTGTEWGCTGLAISGADGIAVGTGNQNTADIVNGCSALGIAARICFDLSLNGYNDWFLPSKDELDLLYSQKSLVGGFSNGPYWSSTEGTINHAWCQYFGGIYDGYQSNNGKTGGFYYVRAVRGF